MKWVTICLVHLTSIFLFAVKLPAQDTTQEVITWLTQNSFPVSHVDPGNGFTDLQPLKKILEGVQFIGLGEATHGTSEFFKIKGRLVEFLVSEMGFTAIALESTSSNCEAIDDYIVSGKGDLYTALGLQGYAPWDTEEMASLLSWLKEYNHKVPDEKKVRFYGIDFIAFPKVGTTEVLAYLKNYAPEKARLTDSLFHIFEIGKDDSSAVFSLDQLIEYFNKNKDRLVSVSSLSEWQKMLRHLELLEQRHFAFVGVPKNMHYQRFSRDDYMAQNLLYLVQSERPNTKFIFSAHNDHVKIDTLNNFPGGKTVGFDLFQQYGDKYYAFGLQCNEGTYQSRLKDPSGRFTDFKLDTILPVEQSFGWYLARTGKGNIFIDLRHAPEDSLVEHWLNKKIITVNGSWPYKRSSENHESVILKGKYDGIVFIENSTPTHLTKNALKGNQQP
jgi:erythromycin esterase